MLKFLYKNYPVLRVKHEMHFRRAIILDDGTVCILGDENHHKRVRRKLIETLNKVFSCGESISRPVLNNFLQIK